MSVNETEEQWRPVVGWEDLYLVSSHGRVRSLHKGRGVKNSSDGILKFRSLIWGYPRVILTRKGKPSSRSVHSLVIEAFVGPRPEGMDVCHNDGNPLNSHVSNLRYGTRSENILDAVVHGTHGQASRTHCRAGHEYTEENTYRPKDRPSARLCRKCRSDIVKGIKPDYSEAVGMVGTREAAEILGVKPALVHPYAKRSPDFPEAKRVRGRNFWDPDELRAWRARHPARKKP